MGFLLGALFTSASAQSDGSNPLLGVCFLHNLAFPNGPDAAGVDLTLSLCHLIQEQIPEMQCEADDMSGAQFLSHYNSQAEFCEDNAELITSVVENQVSDSEAQKVLQTSIFEALYMVNQQQSGGSGFSNENATAGRRRRLFLLIGAAIIFVTVVVFCLFLYIALIGFDRRRALSSGA